MIINWEKPNLNNEVNEYFENEYTKEYLLGEGISFKCETLLIEYLNNGELNKLDLRYSDKLVNMTLNVEDFKKEIKDEKWFKKSLKCSTSTMSI